MRELIENSKDDHLYPPLLQVPGDNSVLSGVLGF